MTNTPSMYASNCKEYAQYALKSNYFKAIHYLRMYG